MKQQILYQSNFDNITQNTQNFIKNKFDSKEPIYIKLHFGEPGNDTALTPQDIEPIIQAFKDLNLETILVDTPVAYRSPRGTVQGYTQVVKDRGYDKLSKFKISDKYVNVKTKDMMVEVAKELAEAKNVLVLSHVKGHSCAGFGGAIKNLAMGGVSIQSKKDQHTLCEPKFIAECQGCGKCVELCPANAITLENGKAKFDLSKCYGCSICELQCPHDCLAPKTALFDDLLAQAASAVIQTLPQNTYYINLIKNISQLCDCERKPGPVIAPDTGILYADQAVCIDQASLDLINKKVKNSQEVFNQHNHKDPYLHVEYTAKYTDQQTEYELKPIS